MTAVDGSFDSGNLDPERGLFLVLRPRRHVRVRVHPAPVDDRPIIVGDGIALDAASARGSATSRGRASGRLAERLIEVGDEIGGVFDAGGEAHDVVVDATFAPLIGRQAAV